MKSPRWTASAFDDISASQRNRRLWKTVTSSSRSVKKTATRNPSGVACIRSIDVGVARMTLHCDRNRSDRTAHSVASRMEEKTETQTHVWRQRRGETNSVGGDASDGVTEITRSDVGVTGAATAAAAAPAGGGTLMRDWSGMSGMARTNGGRGCEDSGGRGDTSGASAPGVSDGDSAGIGKGVEFGCFGGEASSSSAWGTLPSVRFDRSRARMTKAGLESRSPHKSTVATTAVWRWFLAKERSFKKRVFRGSN